MTSFMEKQYRLKADPFDNKVALLVPMAGRQKEHKLWRQVLDQRVGQRGNSYNFIVGDYGDGKSFSLFKICEEAKKERANVLPIFVKLLPEDTVSKFGLDLIQRVFVEADLRGLLSRVAPRDYERLKGVLHEPGIVFEKARKGNELALAYLRADRSLGKQEMKTLGVVRSLNSTERAKDYLLAFLYLLKSAKIDTLLLAVDEVEYIFSQMRGAKISLAFNTLRGIHDLQSSHTKAHDIGHENLANIVCFFGISEDGWRLLKELHKRERGQGGSIQAFMDRKDKEIFLEPLNKSETRDLIELRLRYDRVADGHRRDPLIPFDEGFVKYVFELTQGKPRDIVRRCDIVLLDGLEQKVPLITAEFARKVYESHGQATEPTGKQS